MNFQMAVQEPLGRLESQQPAPYDDRPLRLLPIGHDPLTVVEGAKTKMPSFSSPFSSHIPESGGRKGTLPVAMTS